MIVDTHCHLLDEGFDVDRAEVLDRARSAGVVRIVVVGETYDENVRILELTRNDPMLLAAAGHYPSHLDLAMAEKTVDFIRENRPRLAAIGEVGVDHRITEDRADHDVQDEILRRFARLSEEVDLPLSVHSRSAGRHAIQVLRETGVQKVVMHAFDGKFGSAMAGLEAGYFFSVPPSVVRSRQKQKLVKSLPLDRLLLESDAPVLGPDPRTRNEPCNCRISAEHIAALKEVPQEEVLEVTSENARALFYSP